MLPSIPLIPAFLFYAVVIYCKWVICLCNADFWTTCRHLDVTTFKPLWAAQAIGVCVFTLLFYATSVNANHFLSTSIPSAISCCGQSIILALPRTCRFRQFLGSSPPLNLIHGPPDLRQLHALPTKDLYLALDKNNNIVTWDGRTGVVLHYVDHQDVGENFFFVSLPQF